MTTEVNPMPRGRVLIIDDKHNAFCSSALRKAYFAVTEAIDGKDVVRRLEGGNFDVVLIDVRMPEKNGLELLREVHSLSPDLPVIVMVSHLNNQFAVMRRNIERCNSYRSRSARSYSAEVSATYLV
jgi:DNA-binding NtrC family response regulator